MSPHSNRRQVVNAALIVGILFLVSRILGFVRQAVFGYYFGTETMQADAFALVVPIPDLVFAVIAGGALGSAFIPVFADYWADPERPDTTGGWQLFSAILNLVLVAATATAVLLMLFTPHLLRLLYPEKLSADPALLALSTDLLRLMLLSTIVFGASGVVMAALNGRQHFTMPALATVVYNVGIIAGIVIWKNDLMGVGYGTLAGSVGHLAVQVPVLRRMGAEYRPILTLSAPPVRQILRLMAPRVLGLSFSYLNPLFIPWVAQTLPLGSLAALGYGYRIMLMPQGILGQALGVASFPTFAALAARHDHAGLQRLLNDTLRLIIWAGLPLTVLLMVLRQPFITLFLERGRFDSQATALVATALFFYMPALIPLALIEVIVRAFYALKDTVTPVWAGALQIGLMVGMSLWLGRLLFPAIGLEGAGGVALGFTLSNWLEAGLLIGLIGRKLTPSSSSPAPRQTVAALLRIALAALLMAVAMQATLALFGQTTGLLPLLLQLTATTAIGGAVYLLACHLLGVEELQTLRARLRRR
jgi:putative peptidoglycan lipid II flippase